MAHLRQCRNCNEVFKTNLRRPWFCKPCVLRRRLERGKRNYNPENPHQKKLKELAQNVEKFRE